MGQVIDHIMYSTVKIIQDAPKWDTLNGPHYYELATW